MKPRIFGLENEYGLIFSPNGRIYLPMEKVLGYIFEGLIPNSWPSNAFLVNGARFYQDTGCHPEYSTPECDSIVDLVVHDKAGERLLEACLPAAEERLRKAGYGLADDGAESEAPLKEHDLTVLFAALEFYVHACAKLGIEGDASVALRRRVARLLAEKQLNRAYRASHEALKRLNERLEQS